MEKTHEFYEVRSLDDNYGLSLSNEYSVSAEKALEAINSSYEYAKAKGFDNRDHKWLIVCNQGIKVFDRNGVFLKEEKTRFVVEQAEYSFYDNAYVFVG